MNGSLDSIGISVDASENADRLVVRLTGDAGMFTGEDLVDRLLELAPCKPTAVILDLDGLSFISSLSLGAMVSFALKVTSAGGTIRAVKLQPFVREVFDRTRLSALFGIE